MSLVVKNSLQGTFALVYSGDPSLQPRPADLTGEAAETEKAERKKAQEEWDALFQSCRETGQWSRIVRPGEAATVFSCELPKGERKRALVDMCMALVIEGKQATLASRLFRVAVKSAINWPTVAPKIEMVTVDGMELVAPEVVDFLDDQVGPGVVSEIGNQIFERLKGPSGK